MSQYHVAVVGGGPAGLHAALVLTRAGRDVVVVDAGSPRSTPDSLVVVRHAVHDFEQGLALTLAAHNHQKETS